MKKVVFRNAKGSKSGSILLVSLLVIALLMFLAVAFSVIVRLELRKVVSHQELLEARAVAKLGAYMAIAKLQEDSGLDTRVTFPLGSDASVNGGALSFPIENWTGVKDSSRLQINTDGDYEVNPTYGDTLSWLVSGDPAQWILDGQEEDQAVRLVGPGSVENVDQMVHAPLESLEVDGEEVAQMAWWVGDQGVKARANLGDKFLLDGDNTTNDRRHLTLQRSGVEVMLTDGAFDPADADHQELLDRTLSNQQLNVFHSTLTGDSDATPDTSAFHDVSLHSQSLMTNTQSGGYMKDLMAVLEEARSNTNPTNAREHLLPPSPGGGNQIEKLFAHSDRRLDQLLAETRIKDYVASDEVNWGQAPRREYPNKPDYRDRIFPPMGSVPDNAQPWQDRNAFNRAPTISNGGRNHLAHDSGGPFWRQLLAWATTHQRFEDASGYTDEVERLYSSAHQVGVSPIILRYTMLRFYTYDSSDHTFHLHYSPVVSIWNPTDIDLPAQDYFMHLYVSREQNTDEFGGWTGVGETIHFRMQESGVSTWENWPVRLMTGWDDDGSLQHSAGYPMVFVGEWNGRLDAGERVVLAVRSGARIEMPDSQMNSGLMSNQSGGVQRLLWIPNRASSPPGGDTPHLTIPLTEWDASDFGSTPLGSAYVYLELNNTRPEDVGLMNYGLSALKTLEEISITFNSYAIPYTSALQLSPRFRRDLDANSEGRLDLSHGRGVQSAVIDDNEFQAPTFTIASPPIRIPASLRTLDRLTTPVRISASQLPTHNQAVYGVGNGDDVVPYGLTIGMRMPDQSDPYYAGGDPQQANLYAPYAQLAFGNPMAPYIGRAPPERGPRDSGGLELGYNSPPQYIGGWSLDMSPFLEDSIPRFGFSADSFGSENIVIREFPDSIHDVVSIASFQHAMPYTQEAYQFKAFGLHRGLNHILRVGGMDSHGWGANNAPLNAIGNSLAPPFIPPDQYQQSVWFDDGMREAVQNFHTLYDYSYLLNEALWDDYYLSSNANSRLLWEESSWNEDEDLIERDVEESASNLKLNGGFNVNSTSVAAWAILLQGLMESPVPVDGTFESPVGIAPFSRFIEPGESLLDVTGSSADDEAIYQHTYRGLTKDEIWNQGVDPDDPSDDTGLAVAIVEEVKKRGPFLSLSSFVNRNLVAAADDPEGTRLKGALQAAIDAENLNEEVIDGEVISANDFQSGHRRNGNERNDWDGLQADHVEGIPLNWGAPGFLTQADVLSRIGAVLRARSDTFVIRATGQLSGGQARAYCEVIVQRDHSFVDDVDVPITELPDLVSGINQQFGRRYRIVSFRWLGEEDI